MDRLCKPPFCPTTSLRVSLERTWASIWPDPGCPPHLNITLQVPMPLRLQRSGISPWVIRRRVVFETDLESVWPPPNLSRDRGVRGLGQRLLSRGAGRPNQRGRLPRSGHGALVEWGEWGGRGSLCWLLLKWLWGSRKRG